MLPDIRKTSGIGKTVQMQFGGLDRRPGAADGTFSWMDGMTAKSYPHLAGRATRYYLQEQSDDCAMLGFGNALLRIMGGYVWYNDWILCAAADQRERVMVPFGNTVILVMSRELLHLEHPLKGRVDDISEVTDTPEEGDAWAVTSVPSWNPDIYLRANGEWVNLGHVLEDLEAEVKNWALIFRDGTYQEVSAAANTIEMNPDNYSLPGVDPATVPQFDKLFKPGDAVTIECAHPENCMTLIVREVTPTELRFYENSFHNYVGRHTAAVNLSQGTLCEACGWFREDRGYGGGGDVKKYFVLPSGVNLAAGDYIEYVFDDSQMNPLNYSYLGAVMKFYRADGTEIPTLIDIEPADSYDETLYPNGPTRLTFGAVEAAGMMEWGDLNPTIRKAWPEGLVNVFEDSNRLWGWNGRAIYASKLGDPSNWFFYDGLSEDGWSVEIRRPEEITGGISLHGYPTFYTENRRYMVYGTAPGNFQLSEQDCFGVREDCAASMAIVDGELYYVSRHGVMRDTGAVPQPVGEALGDWELRDAVGGGVGEEYWLSATDQSGERHTLVFDTAHGIWVRDGNDNFRAFTSIGGQIYGMTYAPSEDPSETPWWYYYCMYGTPAWREMHPETENWKEVVTNDYAMQQPNRKRVHRVQIRVSVSGAVRRSLQVAIMYDSSGSWEILYTIYPDLTGAVKQSRYIPVLPRRCDHFRLRFSGNANWELESLALETRQGSAMF